MPSSLLLDLENFMIAMALITPRTFVCLAILPGFGTRTLVSLVRNSIGFAIALPAVLPTYIYVQSNSPDFFLGCILAFKESAIGLMLGVLMSIPIWVAQSVGSILDTQRSPIQIQSNSASLDQDASAVGAMLLQALVLVMIQTGLFTAFIVTILESYRLWPAFNVTPPFELGHLDVLLKRFGDFFWYIVVYGGPVIIPLLLVDFTFAVIGVFASNLQVSFASAPIKSLVGLFVLLVYWPTLSRHIGNDFSDLLQLIPSFFQATSKS